MEDDIESCNTAAGARICKGRNILGYKYALPYQCLLKLKEVQLTRHTCVHLTFTALRLHEMSLAPFKNIFLENVRKENKKKKKKCVETVKEKATTFLGEFLRSSVWLCMNGPRFS